MYSFIETASRKRPMKVMMTSATGKTIHHQTPATSAVCWLAQIDHRADRRRVDVGEAEHRQRHLEADRPVDVVHGRGEDDRQHIGQVLLDQDLARAHAREDALCA